MTAASSAVSTWTAVRKDGTTYHDGEATFARLRDDPALDALILARDGATVVVKLPAGTRPFFMRRYRNAVDPNNGKTSGQWEFAAAVGWEYVGGAHDGRCAVAWLLHDGSVVLGDATDLDDLGPGR